MKRFIIFIDESDDPHYDKSLSLESVYGQSDDLKRLLQQFQVDLRNDDESYMLETVYKVFDTKKEMVILEREHNQTDWKKVQEKIDIKVI
jgi:hypothetical protein